MQFMTLDRKVSVCGQLSPSDFPEVAAQHFQAFVNNRPDGEAWFGQTEHAELERTARLAGVTAYSVPFTLQTLTTGDVRRFHDVLATTPGKVLISCASGFRSALIWAIANAAFDGADLDAAMQAAKSAGRPLDKQRPLIEQLIAELTASTKP